MKIIRRDILDQFVRAHADVGKWIGSWVSEVEEASWTSPNDIKEKFCSASFLKNNVVIFNVKGNTYRLEVRVAFGVAILEVLWAGTHAEYDKRNRGR